MKPKIQKFIKFIISGGLAAATSLIIYSTLIYFFNIYYILASIISFLLSITVGFYLQKYVTFKDASKSSTSTQTKKQITIFFSISLLNLLINVILLAFFVQILGVDKFLSKVLTLGILACWNFFVYEKFVFGGKKLNNLPLG
jgi:putative flippase GtrA